MGWEAVGRKNWLFVGSDEGSETNTTFVPVRRIAFGTELSSAQGNLRRDVCSEKRLNIFACDGRLPVEGSELEHLQLIPSQEKA